MEFPGGPPLQKIQINGVLPALHSICTVLLVTLWPSEGLWSPLTAKDKEANSSIALFPRFWSIDPRELLTCIYPSRWRVGKGRHKGRKWGSRKSTGMCLKNFWRWEESLPSLLAFFALSYSSPLHNTPPCSPLKPPPPTPQGGNSEGRSVSIA